MKINIKLSTTSIQRAITKLQDALDGIRWGTQDLVECLAEDGAGIANEAYGSMDANAIGYSTEENTAIIAVTGEDNLIAEFGAGDDTDPATGFENQPDTPVYAGSYSELEGSGEYAEKGYWHFGGVKFYGGGPGRVEPRNGLMKAKVYIISESENVAKEVIKL